MELQSTPPDTLSSLDADLSVAPLANMPTIWPIICGSMDPLAAARPDTMEPSPDLAPSVCMNDCSTEPRPRPPPWPPWPLAASESCSSDLAASRNGFGSSSTLLSSTEDGCADPASSSATSNVTFNRYRNIVVGIGRLRCRGDGEVL